MTVRSTGADRSELTLRANAGLRLGAAGMVLVSAFMTLALVPGVDPAGDRLPAALAGTAVAIVPIMLGTTAVRLRGTRVEVVNAILVSTVELDDVAYVDHRNGFEIVLRSGHRVEFAGSAPSLIGAITGYRSARRMIDRLQAAVDRPLTVVSLWQPGDYPVTRRPRTTAMLWCAAYVLLGTAAALAIGAGGGAG